MSLENDSNPNPYRLWVGNDSEREEALRLLASEEFTDKVTDYSLTNLIVDRSNFLLFFHIPFLTSL